MKRAALTVVVLTAAVVVVMLGALAAGRAGSIRQPQTQSSVSPAQEGRAVESAPPGVTFLKLEWSVKPQGRSMVSLADDLHRNTAEDIYTGGPPLPSNKPKDTSRPGDGPRAYVYSVKVRNDNGKAITAASFDYVFNDPETGREVGRHRFYSFLRIDKHKSETLNGTAFSPPTKTVSAETLGKDGKPQYGQRAEFRCVVFADNIYWKNGAADESECSDLKERWREYLKTGRVR